MTAIRTFVAIPLPAELQERTAQVQAQMRGWPMQVSWTRPGNLHLTLRFLGDVPEEAMPAIEAAMRQGAAGHAATSLALNQLGAFPGWRRPRVIWIGPERENRHLARLAEDVAAALKAAGYPGDEKQFRAHVTIGRVRTLGRMKDAEEQAAGVRAGIGRLQVSELVLMKSTMHPQGAIYEPLVRVPLQAGGGETPES